MNEYKITAVQVFETSGQAGVKFGFCVIVPAKDAMEALLKFKLVCPRAESLTVAALLES